MDIPSYIVTYWLFGEPERQSRTFNDKQAAKDFMVEIAKSPHYNDGIEPAILFGYITAVD